MMKIQGFKDLDAILVPISGGGMTAGIAIAAKAINPDIKGYFNLKSECELFPTDSCQFPDRTISLISYIDRVPYFH